MVSVRRAKHGVTTWQVDKAWNGYTIFCPMYMTPHQMEGKQECKVFLLDMKGDIVHHWTIPGMIKLHGELLPNGNLLCSVDESNVANAGLVFTSTTVMELDWDSNVVWRHVDPYHDCHDRCRLRNGNTLLMRSSTLSPEKQAKVKGGVPGTENNGKMYTLSLVEITPEGKVIDEMNLSDVLDPDIDIITSYGARELWPGLNSIEEMPDGTIVSTSYNLSTCYIWDRANKKVKWRFGQGKNKISFPHDPQPLQNGNILIFDNGRYYVADPNGQTSYFPPDFSRVIEVNPNTNEIEWEYRAENPVDFYSTYISSNQRLPNGNTLICEGAMGRIFEVTKSGEIVWEYVSPIYTDTGIRFGKTNAVFRSIRYGADYPGLQGKNFDDAKNDILNRFYGSKVMKFANELNK